MSLESIVKMLIGGLNSYRVQAVFSYCKHYTAKNRICQVLWKIFFAVLLLQRLFRPAFQLLHGNGEIKTQFAIRWFLPVQSARPVGFEPVAFQLFRVFAFLPVFEKRLDYVLFGVQIHPPRIFLEFFAEQRNAKSTPAFLPVFVA